MEVPHIDIHNKGIDPAVAAAMSRNDGGLLGGGGLLTGLLLSTLFGRGGWGGWGGGIGHGGAAAGLAEAQTIASITSAKDAVAATQAAQTALTANVEGLSKQLCCSTSELQQAINAITPQMLQGFAALSREACQNQAATISAVNHVENTLSAQAERNAAANALAICQTQNMINAQTCEIKQAVAAEGAATRALINQNTLDDLREQKNALAAEVANLKQTAAIVAAVNCGHGAGNGNNRT